MRRVVRRAAPLLCRSHQFLARRNAAHEGKALSHAPPAVDTAELDSPFLSSLLEPPVTVALHDATRTYSTMDVVEPPVRYDPRCPNVYSEHQGMENGGESEGLVMRAHRAGKLWSAFAAAKGNDPPEWFYKLCEDLYYRRHSEDEMDATALSSDVDFQDHNTLMDAWRVEKKTSESNKNNNDDRNNNNNKKDDGKDDEEGVDPYLWLPFDLLNEGEYSVGPYVFPSTATYTHEQRTLLCLGDTRREYVHFCNTYAFPERVQIPTSVGTQPAKLYVDPLQETPVVYIQLSDDFPPAMWLPVKGTAAAVRRVLAEFASISALHRDWHHEGFEERFRTAQRMLELQRMPSSEGDILRYMSYDARNEQFVFAPIREFPNQQEFFLGEHDDPERLLEHVDLCPFLFSIPHLRTVVDPHAEHMTPTIEGPGVATSLYRCVFSKTLLFVQVQLSAEVKLPPQDPEAFRFMWKDSQVFPKMHIPVFVRVVWPDNERMCGGGQLVRRFNRFFKTEFASDIPVDAVMALLYIMQWAKQLPNFLGVRGMRERLAELEAAAQMPEPAKLYPATREIPNPEYTVMERIGMHVQYLAQLGDPEIALTIQRLLPEASAPVRMGCAKAALIAGERELFRHIVSSEPPGRMQVYMTKLVRKRKSRDLIDSEPRLLEEQYEFAAPLWTKRGTRIDKNTLEGAVDMQGRIGG
ncbi:putative LSU ribosomal protein, mitochondrial [Trypanosoma cruzi]|nr:putative LSU ribosomal protein, mitochondrial [Trypanosoma cruzi]